MKRLIPSPPLSFALFIVWLLLNQSVEASTLVSGVLLAIAVPLLTKGLRPATVRMRRPGVALKLWLVVLYDMSHSVFAVTRALLSRRSEQIQSKFVLIPLDMRDPNGLAVLAMIMCLTPGTAWGEVAFDRSVLLIHVFDLEDEAAFIAQIKTRYERPLMEIFES
ncbi:multicomponent K+:H+ antiporter subunit E [Variovorax boronicumulans]|jgi:multicomponent K+:H+ antiporter subunit E|uniref:Multicomponent K+:H+ antiporter subunit E n=1 Tax=Variovorax boronicumulans TaxID=436515 RepID=A0AAW8CSA0_9BURK|nr:Na+/H+ antiporter subunit E [Variovorax boronicumulans]MDP9893185.1 multicomponent K+:H+ antiporter subunit E [Variovorax boronicumulans]MDP9990712.1 multicomponent K+:H+ antiporter subunit E [Variovorax boronicumulans]MDQ0002740.1 multicomponent K+:H+ antiporter subunit E [Variovorax boronicumulans]MDQ0052468.1 multicomponent K+:H+ antiporter subunit E [Variovorax boronicumulans]